MAKKQQPKAEKPKKTVKPKAKSSDELDEGQLDGVSGGAGPTTVPGVPGGLVAPGSVKGHGKPDPWK